MFDVIIGVDYSGLLPVEMSIPVWCDRFFWRVSTMLFCLPRPFRIVFDALSDTFILNSLTSLANDGSYDNGISFLPFECEKGFIGIGETITFSRAVLKLYYSYLDGKFR